MKHTPCVTLSSLKRTTWTVLFIFDMVTILPLFGYMVLHPEGQTFIHHVISWGFYFYFFLFFWRVFLIGVLWCGTIWTLRFHNHHSKVNKIKDIIGSLFISLIDSFVVVVFEPSCSVNAVQPSERNIIQCRCCMHVFSVTLQKSSFGFFFFFF